MGRILRSWGEKFLEFFPAHFGKIYKIAPKLPTTALVTDIGNDLLYGVTPDRLLEWVERCLDRLADAGAATIVTQLPVGSIERLGERRFQFFRRLFFPRSTLTLADAQAARSRNQRAARSPSAKSRKIPVIPVSASWYGFDPIHLKRRAKRDAWPDAARRVARRRANRSRLARRRCGRPPIWPLWRRRNGRIFGIRRRAAQPSGRFADGTTISLY